MKMLSTYFILFLIYSFIGWTFEIILSFIKQRKFVNRGFLIGPYCPIYGTGGIILIICLKKFIKYPILVFLMALLLCSALEYVTSYVMEKLFKARWWDYSDRKIHINGRICLEYMLAFGILGTIIIYIINPYFMSLLTKIPNNIFYAITLILLALFIVDNIVSFKIIYTFKNTFISVAKDNTEEINKIVHEILLKKTGLSKRLKNAFPNLEVRIKKLQKQKRK